jgi:hypothetical protein
MVKRGAFVSPKNLNMLVNYNAKKPWGEGRWETVEN